METLRGTTDTYSLTSQQGGKGKFGGVWLGTSQTTGKRITVKRIEQYGTALPALMRRLVDVKHPNIAPILDTFVAPDGCLYVVREYIEGTDLKKIFTQKNIYRKVDEMRFIKAGCSILSALQAVHEAGIVHRDIKPSNIVVRHSEGTSPLEADFADCAIIDFEQASPYPDTSGVRSSFALIYSPPEMLLKYNSLVGPPTDLFALSIMLFQLVMGKAPYTDCNPEILVNLQLTYPMKQPARMADDLYAVLSRAAYKKPFGVPPRRMPPEQIEATIRAGVEGRYQTAADMLADLQKVTTPFKKVSWLTRHFSE